MKITKKQIIGTAVTVLTLLGITVSAQSADAAQTNVYRLYNKVSMEHLYTADKYEYDNLPKLSKDWKREGINFQSYNTNQANTKAVNRVYNPRSGEHIYTQDTNEVRVLTSRYGWRSEGVAFYSPKTSSKPVYRVFNPGAGLGAHFVTGDGYEKNSLVSRGWKYEGIAWYAISGNSGGGNVTPPSYPHLVIGGVVQPNMTGWTKHQILNHFGKNGNGSINSMFEIKPALDAYNKHLTAQTWAFIKDCEAKAKEQHMSQYAVLFNIMSASETTPGSPLPEAGFNNLMSFGYTRAQVQAVVNDVHTNN
ncbi:hypothetical protein [Lactococcus garvieae]|uniref:DUF5648 domain-containing protein n=1 Tax=Lactococcus garvieae DCC43 TaxID=1231377 RepID=K2PT47_9LACT|nr:hypothetical protein [Lactococcus garvieae]EKF50636.1 hypothetical protein C426_1988 [Lactococcus garvieae DCC43]